MQSERSTTREQLRWFLDNLDLQLEDEYLIQHNVRVLHFWDTADVRRAVLGLEDLIVGDGFDLEELNRERTLATCLASDGWLGTIQLLEPHQAEFVKSLRNGFGLSGRVPSQEQINHFFATLGISADEDLQLTGFSRKSAAERQQIMQRYAGKAMQLFKAVQCCNGNWRTRLASLYKGGKLEFSTNTVDYSDIFSSSTFREMRHRFSSLRSDRSINNIADATCICMLERQLNGSLNGLEAVPRFFDSRGVFSKVANSDPENRRLMYVGYDKKKRSILRDWDYYAFRAMLSGNRLSQDPSGLTLKQLRSVHGTVSSMLDASGEISASVLEKIQVGERTLGAVIGNLRQYWFLESVWLPFAASDAVSNAATTLEHLNVESVRSKAFLASVNKAIEDATKVLESNSSSYRWYRDLWRTVGESAKRLSSRLKNKAITSSSLYRALGIPRFGVPSEFRPEIEVIIDGLVSGEEESIRRELTRLSKLCVDGRDMRAVGPRTIVVSVLWALDMHTTIRELEINFKEEATWLVGIATASAIYADKGRQGLHGLRELEARYRHKKVQVDEGDIMTLLAYLNFHAWRQEGGVAFWVSPSDYSEGKEGPGDRAYFKRAMECAEAAHLELIEDLDKRAYALNLILFYLTEGGSSKDFIRAQEVSKKLRNFRENGAIWQYKYDDTLARYFHRRSESVSNREQREALLNSALIYSGAAVSASPGDVRVDDFHAFIVELLNPLD